MNLANFNQLTSWKCDSLLLLFHALTPRLLQVEAALTRQTPCSLYVDHAERPRAAALRIGVCWYVAGNLTRQFLQGINEILPRDIYSVLILDPSITASERALLCEGLYFVRAKSRYAKRTASDTVQQPLPAGYDALPVNQHLLEGDLEGASDLREGILHDWMSMEVYNRDGFGFAVAKDAKIVSHSLTDYVCGDRCEIGVFTDPAHRNKGLGAHVASLTANEAFARGLNQVGWMSWANNAGSIAVSKRAGFIEECQYDIYINHWPAGNPGDMTVTEFRAFATDYERQFADHPPTESGYPHIVAATAWALAGESASCRDSIHRAIDLGWLKTLDQLRELWPELLRSSKILENEEWRAVFSRLRQEEDGCP
ncbi:GNAT family N-acetyltransferase [Candidatus Bipolaricaulota bacterium]